MVYNYIGFSSLLVVFCIEGFHLMKIEYGKWWNGFVRLIFNEKKIHHDEWIAKMELPELESRHKFLDAALKLKSICADSGQDLDSIRIPLQGQLEEEYLIPLARHKKFSDVVDGDWKEDD